MSYLQSGLVVFTFAVLGVTALIGHDYAEATICAAGTVVGALGIWATDIQRRRFAILHRIVDAQTEQLRLARTDRGS
jgi:hypothetical protein